MELQQTFNRGVIRGTLDEKNLKCDIGNKEDEKGIDVKTALNQGADLLNIYGNIILDTRYGKLEFRIYQNAKTKKGEDNRIFGNALAIAKDYVSRVVASQTGETASTLELTYDVRTRDFVTRDNKIGSSVSMSIFSTKRFDPNADVVEFSEEDLKISGYINKIAPAPNQNEDEDKEYLVELLTVTYNGEIKPIQLWLEADMVDDFKDVYSTGDTVLLSVIPKMVHVGGKTWQGKAAFGKMGKIVSGYDDFRFYIVGGMDVIEEDGDPIYVGKTQITWLDPKLIKKGLKERENYLESLLDKSGNTVSASNPFTNKKAQTVVKDEDIPF